MLIVFLLFDSLVSFHFPPIDFFFYFKFHSCILSVAVGVFLLLYFISLLFQCSIDVYPLQGCHVST